jgi:hypothetical protein
MSDIERLVEIVGPYELVDVPADVQQLTLDGSPELLEVAVQGPPGGPGPVGPAGSALVVGIAGMALSGHQVVAYEADGDLVLASASQADQALAIVGITTGAAASGASVSVQRFDTIEHLGWTWTPGAPVFLGLAGALVQTPAGGSVYLKPLGVALTATRLALNPQPAMFLA